MNVAVVGTGYVGLVAGACLSDLGHRVVCIDNDKKKVQALCKGIVPIFEPGLEELVRRNFSDRLKFTSHLPLAIKGAEVIFIAVGTPPKNNGEADLSCVEAATRAIGSSLDSSYKVVVNKSTVPPGSAQWMHAVILEAIKASRKKGRGRASFDIVSNPEFLRGGSAVKDFLFPDRIVIGATSRKAVEVMGELYRPIIEGEPSSPRGIGGRKVPLVITDLTTAEMIKYAANAFLATKISFINEVANICDLAGADVLKLAQALGLDERIGPHFLRPGAGYGGSCLPKDVQALTQAATQRGYYPELLFAVHSVNQRQRLTIVEKLEGALNKLAGTTVGLLGLAYKPDTDDIREAVSITVIAELLGKGVKVRGYDPKASPQISRLFPEVSCCKTPYEVAEGCHALVLLTEWKEFLSLDFTRLKRVMAGELFIDGRNMFEPARLKEAGFLYSGFGRR